MRLDKSHSAVGAGTPRLSSLESEGCPRASREPQKGIQGDGSSSKPGTRVRKKQNVVDEGSAGRALPPLQSSSVGSLPQTLHRPPELPLCRCEKRNLCG